VPRLMVRRDPLLGDLNGQFGRDSGEAKIPRLDTTIPIGVVQGRLSLLRALQLWRNHVTTPNGLVYTAVRVTKVDYVGGNVRDC
jgi:hypothetical protein